MKFSKVALCLAVLLLALLVAHWAFAQYVGSNTGSGSGGGAGGQNTSAPLTGDGSSGTPITLPTTANPQVNSLGVGTAADTTAGDFLYGKSISSSAGTFAGSMTAGDGDVARTTSGGRLWFGGTTTNSYVEYNLGVLNQFNFNAPISVNGNLTSRSGGVQMAPTAIASLPACNSASNGLQAVASNSDAACVFGVTPVHTSCTVATSCYTCQVQCAYTGSTTLSWIAY